MNINQRRALQARLGRNVNHANGDVVVEEVVNVPVVQDSRLGEAKQGAYNPPSKATFQTQVITKYYSEAAGVFTALTAAQIAAVDSSLAVALPVFMFCNLDYDAGYPTLKGQFPITTWVYSPVIIYGKTNNPGYVTTAGVFVGFSATVNAQFRDGDVVFVYAALFGGTKYVCTKIVRVTNVPYATLLGSTSSNVFGINLIRYNVADSTAAQLAQYANAILCANLTMFGKFEKDTIDPETFKNPEQQQDNIVDIYYDFRVSKQKGLATYVNYDVVFFRWNMFVSYAEKIN